MIERGAKSWCTDMQTYRQTYQEKITRCCKILNSNNYMIYNIQHQCSICINIAVVPSGSLPLYIQNMLIMPVCWYRQHCIHTAYMKNMNDLLVANVFCTPKKCTLVVYRQFFCVLQYGDEFLEIDHNIQYGIKGKDLSGVETERFLICS